MMNESLSLSAKNIGIKLPNGKVKIMKSENPSDKGTELESETEFYKKYPNINEGSGVTSILLDTING